MAEDIVNLFERGVIGSDVYTPLPLYWTSAIRNKFNWNSNDNDNYYNAIKWYIYINVNQDQLGDLSRTSIKKTDWKNDAVVIMYALNNNNKKKTDYVAAALILINNSPIYNDFV